MVVDVIYCFCTQTEAVVCHSPSVHNTPTLLRLSEDGWSPAVPSPSDGRLSTDAGSSVDITEASFAHLADKVTTYTRTVTSKLRPTPKAVTRQPITAKKSRLPLIYSRYASSGAWLTTQPRRRSLTVPRDVFRSFYFARKYVELH